MGMKIAISGKGGAGKTTIAASTGIVYSKKNKRVILIDADPDANLKTTLNLKGEIKPLIELKEIIAERTGTKPGVRALFFKLNPEVNDIPEKFFLKKGNIMLGVMGSVKGGGLGCTCPENAFLKALLRHLILGREDVVILDMEAGIEHLGRGTTEGIDFLIVVVEPTDKSIETAYRIKKLAGEIGIKNLAVIGNKINTENEKEFLRKNLKDFDIVGFIPFYNSLREAEIESCPFWEKVPEILSNIKEIIEKMEKKYFIHGTV